ncbi:MAG: hypothetical protein FWE74_00030 [Oscillospiraceae bacterium]|nr:hypothetical protein [Oscillospiraceae bacterium]
MRKLKLLMVFLFVCGIPTGCSQSGQSVVVGAKDFTEQYIIGYMLTLLIEDNTDIIVTYKSDLASDVLFAATRTGAVDLYMEYTGTVYGSFLRFSDVKSYEETYEISARELMERYSLRMLDPLGFNNTFALAVRADTAVEHNLKTISDLAEVSPDFVLGGFAEFFNRHDGLPNLKITYDMTFKEERVVNPASHYQALINDEIQVLEVYSTDGMLIESNLVVLEDDKQFFPPYHGAIIIRDDTAEKYPELLEVLNKLVGLLTDEIMRDLNYKVNVEGEYAKDVAENFLRVSNLIK